MPRRSVVFLTLAYLTLTDGSLLAQFQKGGRGDAAATRGGWTFSLNEGKARARQTGKPLMVVIRCVP